MASPVDGHRRAKPQSFKCTRIRVHHVILRYILWNPSTTGWNSEIPPPAPPKRSKIDPRIYALVIRHFKISNVIRPTTRKHINMMEDVRLREEAARKHNNMMEDVRLREEAARKHNYPNSIFATAKRNCSTKVIKRNQCTRKRTVKVSPILSRKFIFAMGKKIEFFFNTVHSNVGPGLDMQGKVVIDDEKAIALSRSQLITLGDNDRKMAGAFDGMENLKAIKHWSLVTLLYVFAFMCGWTQKHSKCFITVHVGGGMIIVRGTGRRSDSSTPASVCMEAEN